MRNFLKIGNFFMKLLLNSPLHGMMSSNTLLISYTGWKSGKTYTTPVNYTQDGDMVRIVSQRDRVWWRNLIGGAPVTLRLRGKDRYGTANAFTDDARLMQGFEAFLRPNPQLARYFGIRHDQHGILNKEDIVEASKSRVVVEIVLSE